MRLYGVKISVLFLFIGTLACGVAQEEDYSNLPRIEFAVVEELLGEAFTEKGMPFSVRPPKGWQQIPDSLMERNIPSENVTLIAAWVADTEEMLLCSRVLEKYDNTPLSFVAARQEKILLTMYDSTAIRSSSFIVGEDTPCAEFIVDDGTTITLTFLFRSPKGRYFQLDYSVPQERYATSIQAIKASFGSLVFPKTLDL